MNSTTAKALVGLTSAVALFFIAWVFDDILDEANSTLGATAWFDSGVTLLRTAPNILMIIAVAGILLSAVAAIKSIRA